VPQAELACGRVGDDGDVMAAQLVKPALTLLARRAVCMAASCCILHDLEIRSSICVSGDARVVRPGLHTSRGRTDGDLSCKAETCRARRRLSSSEKLVGDAANWPRTKSLAIVDLDQGFLSLS
jgi:hypothetical protein